jgi:hypothetical protein
LLLQACALADRIGGLAAEIERTGLMIPTKEGSRSNPLLKEEVAARSLLIRTLQKLGITDESIRPVGRPPDGTGKATTCLLTGSPCIAPIAADSTASKKWNCG